LLEEHESYQKDFTDELQKEYTDNNYEMFNIQLSWNDLPYRYETRQIIEKYGISYKNKYVYEFISQFKDCDYENNAYFIFSESYTSQYFVITEVCKSAKQVIRINNIFPDEKAVHYLAVFDKRNIDDVLLMFHLIYSGQGKEITGGYSLYDYDVSWYQSHLIQDDVVLRSPYLPDKLSKYLGGIPYHMNPAKTVYVRRNISHIIESGYFDSELEFFLTLTKVIMPLFQEMYDSVRKLAENNTHDTNWKLRRTEIRTKLTDEGIINPRWKHELSLFKTIKQIYPDTLYQYRPEWLGKQSLDIFIPSINTAIEYQGIQHFVPVDFFGGEEALAKRKELDTMKKELCQENNVKLIEWAYDIAPTEKYVRELISSLAI